MSTPTVWTHALCERCWYGGFTDTASDKQRPGVYRDDSGFLCVQTPVTLAKPQDEICCSCNAPTLSGIYWRLDPLLMPCQGTNTPIHRETQ